MNLINPPLTQHTNNVTYYCKPVDEGNIKKLCKKHEYQSPSSSRDLHAVHATLHNYRANVYFKRKRQKIIPAYTE